MSLQEEFANSIHDVISDGNHMPNECMRFGMTWGCRPNCPVFERSECEIQEENEEQFKREEKTL